MHSVRSFVRRSLVLCAAVLLGSTAAKAAVVIDTTPANSFQTATVDVFSGTDHHDSHTHNPTGLPYTDTVTASALNTSSKIDTNLSQSLFSYTFTQATTDGFLSAEGEIKATFTVTANITYTLSGNYTMTSNANPQVDGPFSQLLATLTDVTADTTLFDQNSDAFNSNGSFTLGTGEHTGSLTGTLLAGHTYALHADANMAFGADPTASGNGGVALALGPVGPGNGGNGSSAPLPPAAWAGLCTIALAAPLARRRLATTR